MIKIKSDRAERPKDQPPAVKVISLRTEFRCLVPACFQVASDRAVMKVKVAKVKVLLVCSKNQWRCAAAEAVIAE